MDKSSFKKAGAFIEHDGRDLKTVFEKVHLLEQLSQKILAYLEPNCAKFCQVANLRDGRLTLIAANGSVATQIRFQVNDLLRKFRNDPALKRILYIECKVRPEQTQMPARLNNNSTKSMSFLSPETAEVMKAMAESIEDPKLSEIMRRIAGRVKGK